MEEKKEYLYSSLLLIATEKKKILQSIKEITMQQSKSITADDDSILEELQKLIDNKQIELEKMKELEENFSKITATLQINNWKDLSKSINKKDQELYTVLEENQALSTEIEVIDKINIRNMQQYMQELRKKLTKVKQGRIMLNSYELPYSSDAWFIDKKR